MSSAAHTPPPSPWPHRWALVLACATFPLLWWGGFVTATGSGMAFRDWLTSDGAPMPVYPWLSAAGDKFIEHGHRLLAMAVGLLAIILAASTYLAPSRRTVRWASLGLLAGVILQGAIGGLRVVLDERVLALVHGCVGPLFFAATVAMVVITSKNWQSEPTPTPRGDASMAGETNLFRSAALTVVLAYLQLVVGAVVRHSPLMLADRAATIFQIAVYFHVLLALAVFAQVIWLAIQCRRRKVCSTLAAALIALLVAQLMLGGATWLMKYGLPQWAGRLVGEWSFRNTESGLAAATIVTAHGAVGALIVAVAVAIALEVSRNTHLGWTIAGPAAAPSKKGAPA